MASHLMAGQERKSACVCSTVRVVGSVLNGTVVAIVVVRCERKQVRKSLWPASQPTQSAIFRAR